MKKLCVILLALAFLVGLDFITDQINGPILASAHTVENMGESNSKVIEPGTYEIKIKATHPETGEVFTGIRNVVVKSNSAREEFSFQLEETSTIANVLQAIKDTITTDAGIFNLTLQKDYVFTQADMLALAELTGLNSTHMVVFDGSIANGVTATLTLDSNGLILPYYMDGVNNAPKFVFKNLKLSTTTTSSQIMARGCDLILDNVITSGSFKVFGGTGEIPIGITEGGVTGSTSITLINSGPWDTIVGGNKDDIAIAHDWSTATINVFDSVTVNNLLGFDSLNINTNGLLTIGSTLDNQMDMQVTDGLITLGAGSTLDLSSASTQIAGSVTTSGQGARIVLNQRLPLILNNANSAINVGPENILTLAYPDNMSPNVGDRLIYCEQSNLANDENLRSNSYHGIQSDKDTGYIYLGLAISLHSNQNKVTKYFQTVEDAVNWLSTDGVATEDYVLTFRSNEYTLNTADIEAIDGLNKRLKSLKITSQFSLTAEDYLNIGEEVGQTVIRMVNLPADGKLSFALKGAINKNSFTDGIIIEDIQFNSLGIFSIFANCHNVTIGNNVEFIGFSAFLYGGAENVDLSTSIPDGTSLTLLSGNYANVYGGGKVGDVASTKLVVGGMAQLSGAIYGGGENGHVNGDTNLTISGGRFNNVTKSFVIVAGGENGNVNGTATLTVSEAVSLGQLDLAGAYNGTVNSSVIQATSLTTNSIAPKANIYGGAYGTGEVISSSTITLDEGKTWHTVTGGNKNDSTRPITAKINISGIEVTVKDLTNFTELSLGKNGISSVLTILGLLDSDPVLGVTADTSRKGVLRFATANNSLIFSSSQSGAVGNILCNSSGNQIQIYKETSTTSSFPLYVSVVDGINANTKISLTVPNGTAAVDDIMMILGNKNTAFGTKFISAVQGMRVVSNFANEQNVLSLTNALGLVIKQSKVVNMVSSFDHIPVGATSMQTESTRQIWSAFQVRSNVKAQPNNVSKHTEKLYFNITSPDGSSIIDMAGEGYISKQPTVDPVFVAKGLDTYLNSNPTDYYGNITVIGTSGDTLEATSVENDFLGQEASPATNSPINAKWVNYYAHFRSTEGVNTTLRLDTQSPMVTSDATYTQDLNGNYVFTIDLVDPILPTDSAGNVYTSAGLAYVGWSSSLDADGANNFPMSMVGMNDLVQIPTDKQQGTYTYTFTVTADQMTEIQAMSTSTITPNGSVVSSSTSDIKPSTNSPSLLYIYAQDALGNTRRIDVPVTTSVINVTIPLRVGVLAVKGDELTDLKIISPTCSVENKGNRNVKVEINQVTTSSTNALHFVSKSQQDSFASNEINLRIASVDSANNTFPTTSLSTLIEETDGTRPIPLTLGTLSAGETLNFIFDGFYDPINISETADWSMLYLHWNIG